MLAMRGEVAVAAEAAVALEAEAAAALAGLVSAMAFIIGLPGAAAITGRAEAGTAPMWTTISPGGRTVLAAQEKDVPIDPEVETPTGRAMATPIDPAMESLTDRQAAVATTIIISVGTIQPMATPGWHSVLMSTASRRIACMRSMAACCTEGAVTRGTSRNTKMPASDTLS